MNHDSQFTSSPCGWQTGSNRDQEVRVTPPEVEVEDARTPTPAVRRRKERHLRILRATEDCLREDGQTGAQMALIAVRAGVSVGVLYKHYPSRAALIADVYERTAARELEEIRQAAQRAGGGPIVRLTQALRTFCDRALRGGRFTYAIMVEPAEAAVEERRRDYRYRFSAFFAELLNEARKREEIPDQDIELAATGALAAMVEVLVPPLLHDPCTSMDKDNAVIEGLVRFVLRAVGAEPSYGPR